MIAIDRESLILSALSARKIKGSRLMVKGLKFEELLETIEKLRAKQEIKKLFSGRHVQQYRIRRHDKGRAVAKI